MRIKNIIAENFLSYKNLSYQYSNQGLSLVEGPTGVGKSAFLDVVSYGFFGQISKNIASDEVINRKEGKNLLVKLEFENDGKECEVVRSRKHSEFGTDLYVVVDGETKRGKDLRETQKLLESLIGFSFDVFTKATYFSQFSPVDRFLSASDTQKKELITEICDLTYYDGLHEKSKVQVQTVEKKLEVNEQKLNASIAMKEQVRSQLEDSKLRSFNWDVDLTKKYEETQIKAGQFEELKNQKIKSFADRLKAVELSIDDLNNKIKIFSVTPINFSDEKRMIQDKLEVIQKLEQKKYMLMADIRMNEQKISESKSKTDSEGRKIQNKENSTCPHCYQSISYDLIQKHLVELQVQHDSYIVAIELLKKNIAAIDQGLLQRTELNLRLKEIQNKEFELQQKNMEVEVYKKSLVQFMDEKLRLDRSLSDELSSENYYLKQLETLKSLVNPFKDQVNSLMKILSDMEGKDENIILEKQVLDQELTFAKWWKEAFGVYIRSYLMDSFLDQVNDIANEYLETLFDGVLRFNISSTTDKGKEVKEKISVSIFNNGEECSYESLSGGERCRICLSVNLAISDLTCKMSKKSFNILMLDEIFNGLDENGKNQTMKLLKNLEEKFDTIFVIDHTEAFKSMFTNTISISKIDGVSVLAS